MVRNAIRFQKDLSEVALQDNYGTEAQCETVSETCPGQTLTEKCFLQTETGSSRHIAVVREVL